MYNFLECRRSHDIKTCQFVTFTGQLMHSVEHPYKYIPVYIATLVTLLHKHVEATLVLGSLTLRL